MRTWFRFGVLLGALSLGAGAGVAMAQPEDDGAESPADQRATSFQAVKGPTKETIPGGTLLVVAYGVVWLLVFGYVLRVGRLERRTAADLERLEKMLRSDANGGANG
ncbi:MAG: hypothetical protein R3A78_03490 [Polyangiales bacterium]|nr:hypothetical protein [Myxococcales bacterium]